MIAAVNVAIATGAIAGGLIFDFSGVQGVFIIASLVLIAVAAVALRLRTVFSKEQDA